MVVASFLLAPEAPHVSGLGQRAKVLIRLGQLGWALAHPFFICELKDGDDSGKNDYQQSGALLSLASYALRSPA